MGILSRFSRVVHRYQWRPLLTVCPEQRWNNRNVAPFNRLLMISVCLNNLDGIYYLLFLCIFDLPYKDKYLCTHSVSFNDFFHIGLTFNYGFCRFECVLHLSRVRVLCVSVYYNVYMLCKWLKCLWVNSIPNKLVHFFSSHFSSVVSSIHYQYILFIWILIIILM